MNIYQRLNAVRKKVEYIQKDATVAGYRAVTHDQVTAIVRPHLVEHGIMVVPSLVSSNVVEGQTNSGKFKLRYEATYEIAFINEEEPSDCLIIRVEAHADDSGDKAPGKAVSYATKTALLKVLSLETGESDESRMEESKKAEPVTKEQVAEIQSLLEKYGKSTEDFVTYLQKVVSKDIGSLQDMTINTYEWSRSFLESKIKEAEGGS